MKLIDADILERSLTEIDEHINMDIFTNEVRELIDNAPTVEAIPKADYEARLKADLVAMLTELQLEIEELGQKYQQYFEYQDAVGAIQQKIDKLKEVEE